MSRYADWCRCKRGCKPLKILIEATRKDLLDRKIIDGLREDPVARRAMIHLVDSDYVGNEL